MFTKVQLHRNILVPTNYKKQGKDQYAVLNTRAPKSAQSFTARART